MNPASYFADLERNSLDLNTPRPDRFEGTDLIHKPKHIQRFVIEGPNGKITVPPKDIADHITIIFDNNECNIYSMYATVTPKPVDKRNFAFGDSFIFIKNTTEFLKRFGLAAYMQKLKFGMGLVNYYDLRKYSGKTGPLRKPFNFAYQNEFRIIVRPGAPDARRLVLGNLHDITAKFCRFRILMRFSILAPTPREKQGYLGELTSSLSRELSWQS